jgi:hypothetical protein
MEPEGSLPHLQELYIFFILSQTSLLNISILCLHDPS